MLKFPFFQTSVHGPPGMKNKVNDLSQQHSVLNQYMAEIRDVTIQTDSMRFRRNLERVGEIMAYEISKTLKTDEYL